LADPRIQVITDNLEYKDNEKFSLIDGLVYKKDGKNLKFIVLDTMSGRILRIYHDDVAHCGQEKTLHGISQTYWFFSMRKKIYNYIDNCFTCIMADDTKNRFEGETSLYPAPSKAMKVLHLDHFGPLQETHDHYKHIFLTVDAFTKFTWLCPVKTTTTREVIEHLMNIFASFGNPTNIVTDKGTAFTSRDFEKFIEK